MKLSEFVSLNAPNCQNVVESGEKIAKEVTLLAAAAKSKLSSPLAIIF
jgi:hypothetical protein